MMQNAKKPIEKLSIITTVCYSLEILERFAAAVNDFSRSVDFEVELLLIDDLGILSPSEERRLTALVSHFELVRSCRKSGQLAAGVNALRKASGDVVITLDPDMYGNLKDISRFLKRYEAGYVLVYGRRVFRSDVSVVRKLASNAYNLLVRCVFFVSVKDVNTPMLLVAREIMPTIVSYRGENGLAKAYFPFLFSDRFCLVDIEVRVQSGNSSYDYFSLLVLAFRQIIELGKFLRFRLFRSRTNDKLCRR